MKIRHEETTIIRPICTECEELVHKVMMFGASGTAVCKSCLIEALNTIEYGHSIPGLNHKTLLKDCNFAVRTFHALKFGKHETVEDLLYLSDADLLRLPNFGRKSLNEIRGFLKANIIKEDQTNEDTNPEV